MNQGAKREEGIVSTKENGDNVSRKRGIKAGKAKAKSPRQGS